MPLVTMSDKITIKSRWQTKVLQLHQNSFCSITVIAIIIHHHFLIYWFIHILSHNNLSNHINSVNQLWINNKVHLFETHKNHKNKNVCPWKRRRTICIGMQKKNSSVYYSPLCFYFVCLFVTVHLKIFFLSGFFFGYDSGVWLDLASFDSYDVSVCVCVFVCNISKNSHNFIDIKQKTFRFFPVNISAVPHSPNTHPHTHTYTLSGVQSHNSCFLFFSSKSTDRWFFIISK